MVWSLNHPHRKQAKNNNPDALQNSNDGDEKQWNLNIADSTGIFVLPILIINQNIYNKIARLLNYACIPNRLQIELLDIRVVRLPQECDLFCTETNFFFAQPPVYYPASSSLTDIPPIACVFDMRDIS